jgi:HEAT repeat protein
MVAIVALLFAWLRAIGEIGLTLAIVIGVIVTAFFGLATRENGQHVVISIFCGLLPAGFVAFFFELSAQTLMWAIASGIASAVIGFAMIRFRGCRVAVLVITAIVAVCIPPLWPSIRWNYLLRRLDDSDPLARRNAITSFQTGGPRGLPYLFIAMSGESEMARDAAFEVVSRNIVNQDYSATPLLIDLLSHERAETRAKAARTLGAIVPAVEEAIPLLVHALEDGDWSVRYSAALAIGYIGPAAHDAVPSLTKCLRDDDPLVREWAATALGWIGPPAANEAILELAIAARDPDLKVREAAFGAFARGPQPPTRFGVRTGIGVPAIPALIAFLDDPDPWIKERACWTLSGGFGPDDAPELVPLIMGYLPKMDGRARSYLDRALSNMDPDGSIRRAAVENRTVQTDDHQATNTPPISQP